MMPKLPLPIATTNERARTTADAIVMIEIVAAQNGILGGLDQGLALLRAQPDLQAWALSPGAALKPGDVTLRLIGAHRAASSLLNALTGTLATLSGWTTAARALVEAAKPAPVIFRGAANAHPDLWTQLEHAAVAGGCLGADSDWARGLLARDAILLAGDTVRALRAFDANLPLGIPRLTWVDLFHDEAAEAVRVALAFGDKLGGIALPIQEAEPTRTLDQAARIRAQLELAGFPRVQIFLVGNISVELLQARERARIDGFFVGGQIAAAPPFAFTAALREANGVPLGRRGEPFGKTPSLRLKRIA